MGFLNGFIKQYWYYLVIAILLVLLSLGAIYIFLDKSKPVSASINEEIAFSEPEEEEIKTVFVDIKGAVNKPGVYKATSTSIINDIVKLAGGFTKKAYSNNINLSKKVSDEMVIYVFTKSEFDKLSVLEEEKKTEAITECVTTTYEICDCIEKGNSVISTTPAPETDTSSTSDIITEPENKIESPNSEKVEEKEELTEPTSNKISINKANKEELMKLNGIGESKAENIIKYREEHGYFQSLEDIMKVSGIGDAAYEKIKNDITL